MVVVVVVVVDKNQTDTRPMFYTSGMDAVIITKLLNRPTVSTLYATKIASMSSSIHNKHNKI